MTRAEYKARYAAERYAEGLARKRERGMAWFMETFLPSVVKRIGANEKYPTSCVVSDKQADVLWFYMDVVASGDRAEKVLDGVTYSLEHRGRWAVLVRVD